MKIDKQFQELKRRGASLRTLERAYGHVSVDRDRAAAVRCCGLILEWEEVHELAALTDEEKKGKKEKKEKKEKA